MIRVLIERLIYADLESHYDQAIKKTINEVKQAPGCIDGENLVDSHNPRRRIVLSKWRSEAHWDKWYQSQARLAVVDSLTPLLEGPEKILILETQQ